ncbi:MAG: type IV secretion system DNA-binding domain-containing protein [bacterium]|nr:type IV secretion system DNA-binding domain-containing protein [bacterium]
MERKIKSETQPSKDVVYFGKTDFRNAERLFGIKRKDRRQHMYVMGKTGTGKSVLLHNLILQDILNGDGVCVVDPHGELVEGVLEKIPRERLKDVIYFNPADTEFPMGFNPLELPDPKYKHLVASGLMGIFTKIWSNVWSARMEYILNNAILALLDTPNTTLLGIPRLLVDKDYRQQIINNLKDPVVKAFWMNEYEEWQDKFRNEAIAPIQNKVGQFLSTAIVRNVVGQSKSTIDIFDLMNEQKIFLVNVSKGRIGEDNSALMGAMIITKIQLAAMERVRIPEEDRRDFYLFVDEFQNFATDSFAGVLSEARKYRLNLIIAHQYVGQLVTDVSTKVRDAVFGNVGTMIIFRVGAADAEFLENEFEPEFVIQDIVNLPNYRIYLKLMVDGITVRPFSAMTLPPFKTTTEAVKVGDVIAMSRERYARPAVEVEDNIRRWASGSGAVDEAGEALSTPVKHVTASGDTVEMYPAKCSNCGKETRVPFKPTPGKPVYCSECFEKIQKGELAAPERPVSRESGRRTQETMEGLAGLGIEYKQERRAPAPTPHGEWRGGAPHGGPVHRSSGEGGHPRPHSEPQRPHSEHTQARHDDRRHDGGPKLAKPMPQREVKPVEKKRDEIEPGSNADIPALKSAIQEALKRK